MRVAGRPRPAGVARRGWLVGFVALLIFGSAFAGFPQAALADGTGVTVTANDWFAWNPIATDNGDGTFTGAYGTDSPSVTVEQTQNLTDQVVNVSWQHFTPSSNDSTYSGAPTSAVTVDQQYLMYGVTVLECRGTTVTASPLGQTKDTQCYPDLAGAGAVQGGHGQNNAVLAATQNDGTGSVPFHVENKISNDLLGCDATHPCSIVVVPNNGGNQPPPNQIGTPDCGDHSQDFYNLLGNFDELLTADQNHFGPCAWADRFVIPIHFAPLPTDCPDVAPQFTAVGSPMLQRGLGQLLAGWCRGAGAVNITYNSTSDEYEARAQFLEGGGALTSSTDIALVTQPADPGSESQRRFTYAPIANNAIDIPYFVDDPKTGRPITDLRMNADLVAKLLTQSYQPFYFTCAAVTDKTRPGPGCAPTVAGNPNSIFDDPEFQALNFRGDHTTRADFPGSTSPGANYDQIGGFFPTVVAGNTDLVYELTRWVESDPDARAFLAGKPDAYGMHVNTAYLPRNGAPLYPTSQLQPLDPGWTPARTDTTNRFNEGFQSTWNPISGLANVATLMLIGGSTTQIPNLGICQTATGDNADCIKNLGLPVNFPRVGAEPVGSRDLWGVTDNTAANAYQLPVAALVNSAGVAVTPTTVSMTSGLQHYSTNADRITQQEDFGRASAATYPLTVTSYAMVPTCGLSSRKAAAIANMLRHVVSAQTYGVQPGTLTPGLLALTSRQLAQTSAAASAVSSRSCHPSSGTKAVVTTRQRGNQPAAEPDNGSGRTTTHNVVTNNGGVAPRTSGASAASIAPVSGTSSSPVAAPSTTAAPDAGLKPLGQEGSLGLVLPIMLTLGAAFLFGAPLTWWLTATTAGRGAAARLKFWA